MYFRLNNEVDPVMVDFRKITAITLFLGKAQQQQK